MMFTIFDITVFAIIGISGILGLYKGMLNIIINLLGLVASVVAAIFLYPYVKSAFAGRISNDILASTLSGIISYVFSLIALTLITSKIIALFKGISGGVIDRSLGVIFGIFRGWFIALILFAIIAVLSSGTYIKPENASSIILNLDSKKYPNWLTNSKTSNFLEDMLKKSVLLLPEHLLQAKIPIKPEEEEQEDISSLENKK